MNYEFDPNKERVFGIKSAILWENHNSRSTPMLYLSKPKSVTDEEYSELLASITISIDKKYLDKRTALREEACK